MLQERGVPDPFADNTDKHILTVRQLNESISQAMGEAFPRTVWVRGEVQRFPADAARRTHVYFELHETGQSGAAEYQIPVSLMGWDRQRHGLGRYLDGSDPDFQLANKMEVCLECQVDFYAKFGKLSLKIVGLDKSFALGKLEAVRRATLQYLRDNELLELNKSKALSELPLRIGLITAEGSAAEKDFRTGLENSPYGFQVVFQGARMQGEQLQNQVIRALQSLQDKKVDVIVLTRGGGSRADLSWFDQKDLAEAVATCAVPVVAAIGHEIDRSIVDLVAFQSCKTPTAAAEFLVDRVDLAADRVEEAAAGLRREVDRALSEAGRRLEVGPQMARAVKATLLAQRLRYQSCAGRLQSVISGQLRRRQSRLSALENRLISRAESRLNQSGGRLDQLARDLRRESVRHLDSQDKRLDNLAHQARLLDPQQLLARGYTLTLDSKGKTINSVTGVQPGDRLRTRFADGEVGSIVETDSGDQTPRSGKRKASGRTKQKENPGQKTLFR